VGDQLLQLSLSPLRRKVGDLRFEGDYQVGRGIDNGGAKVENFVGTTVKGSRKFARIGVQAHAQHGPVLAFCVVQALDKSHGAIIPLVQNRTSTPI